MIDRTNLPLLVTLALGVFAGALDLGVLSPALPALARTFTIPGRDVAWVFTLYLFANIVSIPVMTKLSDVYGRRPIYIACVGIFVAGSVLAIAAPTFALLLVARAIQALGAGGIFPVAAAAIADRVPLEKRGSALGLLGAVWGLAAIVGPTFGGVVTHFVSWRWIFAANVPLGLIVIIRSRWHVPAAAARIRGPLDVAGLALLAFGLLAVMIGLTRLDAAAPTLGGNMLTLTAIVVALAAFAGLIAVERAASDPVVSPALFGTRQLVVTYTLEVLIGMLEGALFFVPAALVAAQHLSYALAGIVAAVGAVVFVAIIPLAGRALDLYGSRIVLMAGAVCTALGLALLGAMLASLPLALLAMIVAGVGFGSLLGAPTRYIITSEVPANMRATAVGLLSIFLIIGQIFGASLAGGVVGTSISNPQAYRVLYLIFASIALLATCITSLLAPRASERSLTNAA